MLSSSYRFDRFILDAANRQLMQDGAPVEISSRYFDALALLVREQGKLVSKERFMDEVWRGVPVTDEALTQCIRTLRKQLDDDAANPRFIETVPKHGYRFVEPVEILAGDGARRTTKAAASEPASYSLRDFLLLGSAGMVGGGIAGLFGGLLYGFGAASQSLGTGSLSVLVVLTCITILVALVGGAGVAFGIAAAGFVRRPGWHWNMLGGALGGLLVGALGKLLGLDAFNLLFGQSPGNITGAGEGALLGAGVGLGAWIAVRAAAASVGHRIAAAGVSAAAAGILISVMGGRLMGGSLDLLARHFPNSRLRLDRIGSLFGESDFGPTSQMVTGALEAMLFGACITAAIIFARRDLGKNPAAEGAQALG